MASGSVKNEFRLPLHPAHLGRIASDVRERIFFEQGYGERFGVAGDALLLLPKPMHEDVAALRQGQVLWGWPHCVQDERMTQLAIDRHLTLIAWEAMNHWTSTGALTGSYGRRLRAVVISFGATARGAVTGLGRQLRPAGHRRALDVRHR